MPIPYRIKPPALISFRGGRTGGHQLRQASDAHGGRQPDGVLARFDQMAPGRFRRVAEIKR